MKKITVSASRKYDVIVGQGIMENAGSLLKKISAPAPPS